MANSLSPPHEDVVGPRVSDVKDEDTTLVAPPYVVFLNIGIGSLNLQSYAFRSIQIIRLVT